jgi:hypothetical protein
MFYEYNFIVATADMTPAIADLTADELSLAMTATLNKMARSLSQSITVLPGDGWEAMSHDILRIDRHLVVTFLIRREITRKM